MPSLDVSLVKNPITGKFTFSLDPLTGDIRFDNTQTYPVLSTLYMHKGAYYWDQTGKQGTYIYQVNKDKLATGSQLAAYAQDAGDQCISDGLIQDFTSDATRVRTGSYQLNIRWTVGGLTKTQKASLQVG